MDDKIDWHQQRPAAFAADVALAVLVPRLHSAHQQRMELGYSCANSRMTIAVAADHTLTTDDPSEVVRSAEQDLAKMVFRVEATEGNPVRLQKVVAYHTSRGVPVPT